MRKYPVWILVLALLGLSVLPWLACSFQPESLIPEDLRQQRIHYDATVSESQNQTVEAMRQATSFFSVSTVGTANPTAIQEMPEITQLVSTSTMMIIKITSSAKDQHGGGTGTPQPLGTQPGTPATQTPTAVEAATLATPSGMVDRTDIITDESFSAQLEKDAAGSNITNIMVTISPDHVDMTCDISVMPKITQKAVAVGKFMVKDSSLMMEISSIKFGDMDVTGEYAGKLQSRINTSLYRLLPQRYVQNFTLFPGKVEILSKVRL